MLLISDPWVDFGSLRGEEDQVFSFPSRVGDMFKKIIVSHRTYRATFIFERPVFYSTGIVKLMGLPFWGGSNFMLKNRW